MWVLGIGGLGCGFGGWDCGMWVWSFGFSGFKLGVGVLGELHHIGIWAGV